jgi:hypothetical protein
MRLMGSASSNNAHNLGKFHTRLLRQRVTRDLVILNVVLLAPSDDVGAFSVITVHMEKDRVLSNGIFRLACHGRVRRKYRSQKTE